ncbi:MAG: 16S rRNA (cytosine(967)-C(5))-methyltransferase RsmB [Lacrimispora saccharolytica]
MTRPGSRKPENGKQREGKKAGSLQKMPDAREIAADILMEVLEKKQYSHVVLLNALKKYQYLEKQERSFIKRLVDGTLERLMQIDFIIESFSSTPLRKMKPIVRTILRMGVYQICYMDRVPDSAACNEAVKLTVKRGFSGLKGFVNGVLRNIARKKEEISWPDDSVRYCLPQWILGQWEPEYGRKAVQVMAESFLRERPLTVRMNLNQAPREEILESLREQGVEVIESGYSDQVVFLKNVDYLEGLDAFADGFLQVQDLSSSLAGDAAGVKEGSHVIDVCGAPGGKSLHIAELLNGTGMVEVRDLSESKIALVEDNIRRSGLFNIEARVQDALEFDRDSEETADLLIADLPCSGLGIMGRKPDIRYNMTREQTLALAGLQREILSVVWRYVKPGGTMVYSTCTIDRAENEENAAWILENLPFEPVDLTGRIGEELAKTLCRDTRKEGYVQLLPGFYPGDGFFISVFRRKEEGR